MKKKNILIFFILLLFLIIFFDKPLYASESDYKMVIQGGAGSYISDIIVSPDSKHFVTVPMSTKTASFWSIDGKLIRLLDMYGSSMCGFAFSPDSKLLISNEFSKLTMYNMSGKKILTIGTEQSKMSYSDPYFYGYPAFDPNGKSFVIGAFAQGKYYINRYSLQGELIKQFEITPSMTKKLLYSPDGKHIAVVNFNNVIELYTPEGQLTQTLNGLSGTETDIRFSPDSQYIFWVSTVGFVQSTLDGIFLKNVRKQIFIASFSHDCKYLVQNVYVEGGGYLRLSKIDGTFIKNFYGLTTPANCNRFTPDGKKIIAGLQDGTIQIFNIETSQFATLANNQNDWVVFTSDGYFDCSETGINIVKMIKDGRDVYGLDQIAIKYNRPDIILQRLGIGTPGQIKHYYYLYKKRLKKFGLTEEQLKSDLDLPEVTINSKNTNGKILKISFTMEDKGAKLSTYNIFVNGVPLFAGGKKVSGNKSSVVETVELSEGNNIIEISCTNTLGVESYRKMIQEKYTKPVKGDLYFLGFGVSKYKNENYNLKYSDKDVIDLENLFKSLKGTYNHIYTKIYTNKDVTPENIKKAKDFIKKAKVDDTFILFISGHGIHDTDPGATYYYLTYNADIDDLKNTAANFELIEDLMYGIQPRNKLFLMDTCESGEADDEIYLANASRKNDNLKARAVKKKKKKIVKKHDKEDFLSRRAYLFQKDRYIYNDIYRRSGAIVFSSSKGGEYSYEEDKYQNGLFTEEILNAFKNNVADTNGDKMISTDELREYVSKMVPKLSGGLQHPTVDRDNIYQKFKLPKIK